jgi:hypothetical protein
MARRAVPSSTSTPNGALAPLGRPEVAEVLPRQRRDHDPAHAHRPGPRERLGVDPGAHHKDAAGTTDVDAAGPQLPERIRGELQATVRGRARRERPTQRAAGHAQPKLSARVDRDDLAADRRDDGVAMLPRHDSPAVLLARHEGQQLALVSEVASHAAAAGDG